MINKYEKFYSLIQEETGMRNINKIVQDHKNTGSINFEIFFHQDLDGVTSGLCMKSYLEEYGLKLVDTHIIQYGGIEFCIKNKKPDSLAVLVDYANGKHFFAIHVDHHDKQVGVQQKTSTNFKHARSNAETISGEISTHDIFTATDIKLIQTVDSANFLKYGITPDDIENAIFKYNRLKSSEENRFLMGFVVNRLLLALKNKRITVRSLDGKRNYVNKNLLECLLMDSNPSLFSMFNNIKHYINSAVSLEWDRSSRKQNVEKELITPEEITKNLEKYIKSRQGDVDGLEYIKDYRILKQYGIGTVFDTGSYDRYVVFKNYPEADFVCTVFPMGLIQVSCNPFKEKVLQNINLGEITKEVLARFKYQLSNINIPVKDIKKINEMDIIKMRKKYTEDYEPIGFKFDDMIASYKNSIILQNPDNTRTRIDLSDNECPITIMLKDVLDRPYSEWSEKEKEDTSKLKIPLLEIITNMSGGHPSITNIQGLNFLGCRRDLMKILFHTENYTEVMKLMANDFIERLKVKIDLARAGKVVDYETADIELAGGVVAENFEYFLSTNGEIKSVTKDKFIEYGMDSNFKPKKDNEKGFSISIEDKKVIGMFEKLKT